MQRQDFHICYYTRARKIHTQINTNTETATLRRMRKTLKRGTPLKQIETSFQTVVSDI